MDFFNRLGGSIQNVGKEVSKKTKDLGGVVSLNAQIRESENSLNKLYQAVGEKYYQTKREEAEQNFVEETSQIKILLDKIASDKEQLRKLKGLKLCPNCGAEVDNSAAHCQVCGTSLMAAGQVEQNVYANSGQQTYQSSEQQGSNGVYASQENTQENSGVVLTKPEEASVSSQSEENVAAEETAFCPNCRAAVSKDAKFCGKCGYKLF